MYPDPWPKKKHWKRRFIQKSTILELSRILKFRGRFLFFTDNSSYAVWGLRHILANKAFKWLAAEPNDWKVTNSKYSGFCSFNISCKDIIYLIFNVFIIPGMIKPVEF